MTIKYTFSNFNIWRPLWYLPNPSCVPIFHTLVQTHLSIAQSRACDFRSQCRLELDADSLPVSVEFVTLPGRFTPHTGVFNASKRHVQIANEPAVVPHGTNLRAEVMGSGLDRQVSGQCHRSYALIKILSACKLSAAPNAKGWKHPLKRIERDV